MFHINVIYKNKTNIFCSVIFFRNSCLLLDKVEIFLEQGRPQMKIRLMLIACCLPKSTYTHSQDMQFLLFYTETMIEKKRLNVTLYLYSCLVYI